MTDPRNLHPNHGISDEITAWLLQPCWSRQLCG